MDPLSYCCKPPIVSFLNLIPGSPLLKQQGVVKEELMDLSPEHYLHSYTFLALGKIIPVTLSSSSVFSSFGTLLFKRTAYSLMKNRASEHM
ncbi:hypothetical protein M758_UG286500 [Ceratodon purpureus]|nr:hypothetical protein M758_UG286500 [Ceratodon purpureus]